VTDARPQGSARLIHRFVYNYKRPWPEQFDYRPILTGSGVVIGLRFACGVVRRPRAAGVRGPLGVPFALPVWGLGAYRVGLSPHWGQRELVKKYYEERSGPEEPLIAWQMNWKGENFYSGNRVFTFVDLDNKKIRDWMEEKSGTRAYFVLEHCRLSSYRGLWGQREVREVTDKWLCNKCVLVEATM